MENRLPKTVSIRWQCRRGMLELDMILLPFFESQYEDLNVDEKMTFIELLKEPDQTLYQWLIGREEPEKKALQAILQKVRLFKWKE